MRALAPREVHGCRNPCREAASKPFLRLEENMMARVPVENSSHKRTTLQNFPQLTYLVGKPKMVPNEVAASVTSTSAQWRKTSEKSGSGARFFHD
tara:strand:- start:1127 stop:1411 length:285 start_codon:yes stop_codon:yes gene_type:complete